MDELRAKSKATLNQLKFTKVEWNVANLIYSIRFTLSDGQVSPQIGTRALKNSFEFPQNRPIKTIKVRVQEGNFVTRLQFCDAYHSLIHEIKGTSDLGTWHTITAEQGQTFVGFQETHCGVFLRAIGFQTMKQNVQSLQQEEFSKEAAIDSLNTSAVFGKT